MAKFERKLIYHIYQEDGTFIEVLDDVISELRISKQINGGDSEFRFTLDRKIDDFDEGTSIKFNNRVKVYVQDEYNQAGTTLVAFGYIVAYSPYLKEKTEGVEVICLSAVSKLSNDFYRTGTDTAASDLGVELTSVRADEMMEAIITHYRSTEANSMLSNDFTNSDSTPDNSGGGITFDHRFFNMKHLDALRESSKFLPRNKTGGYWFYWRIDTDGKLYVKNISATADHSLMIGKHIREITGEKTIIGVTNRVYFWNEKGTVDPDYIKLTDDDVTSQGDYDIMAEYITDSKVTNSSAAGLLTESKLYDKKDPKIKIRIVLNGNYDLASIKPGQTCQILNTKNNPYKIGSDDVLLIHNVEYGVDTAILEVSNTQDNFEDIIEEERQRLDKELTWFGFITQQLTAAQLGPANRTWSTTMTFSATSGADAYRQVDWTTGIVYLPTSSGSAAGQRVIDSGSTSTMSAATDYFIYLDEETFNTSASNSDSGAAGVIKQGGDYLQDTGKAWSTDQYKGYIVTIGGQTKIIKSNTATTLYIEDRWTIADTTGAYTIKKMTLDLISDKEAISDLTKVVFSNVKANANTASEAVIVPIRDISINLDGSTQIAQRSISADRITADSITANEINSNYIYAGTIDADQINVGTLSGFTITGGTVQTGTTGQRAVLASNIITFYDTDGVVSGILKSNAVDQMKLTGAVGDDILISLDNSTGNITLNNSSTSGSINIFTGDKFRIYEDTYPGADAEYDLGDPTHQWQDLHLNNDFWYRAVSQPVLYHGYASGTSITKDNNSFTLTNPSTGNYTITHNLGTTNYNVQLTPYAASGAGAPSAKVSSLSANSFDVITYDETGSATDFSFYFTLVLNTA